MECNKDEAGRAKEIAEKKFVAKDLAGAKKFATKAHNLYPELEGLAQMMAVLEVHIAAENKVNGDMDWYAILHVNPFADESIVKKQYRKLALLLHPDKNKSMGADGAFKLISEAWRVLSDKAKRVAYDQKRKGLQKRGSQTHKAAAAPYPDVNVSGVNANNNGFYNFNMFNNIGRSTAPPPARTAGSVPRSSPPPAPPRPPAPQKTTTFWTACPFCKMQYEYLRMYENHNLLCPNCQKPFLAVETLVNGSTAPNFHWSYTSQEPQQQRYSNHCSFGKGNSASAMGTAGFASGTRVDSYHNLNYSWGPFSRTAGAASATASTAAAAAAANVVQQTYEKVRREREETQAAAKKNDEMYKKNSHFKKSSTDKNKRHVPGSVFVGTSEQMAAAKGVLKPKRKRKRKVDSDSDDESDEGEDEEDITMMESGGTAACGNSSYIGKNVDNRVDAGMEKMDNGYNGLNKDQQRSGSLDSSNAKFQNATRGGKPIVRLPSNRELSSQDLRNLLMEKARMDIKKKLEEMKKAAENASAAAAAAAAKASASVSASGIEEEAKTAAHGMTKAQNNTGEQHKNDDRKETKPDGVIDTGDNSLENPNAEVAEPVSITVPDPDFYDFDKDRTEDCFRENQMWAAYDDDDGMPRFYALIHKVASLNPFKLQISWLNAKNNNDIAPIDWVGSGFTKTCGDFRAGKASSHDNLNVFSHVVRWEKAARGIIKIFPRKGDVWALYREWSPSWDNSTPEEVRHKYDMVEVLTDFTEELGVSVVPLVKVTGYKTVFHKKHVDPETVQWVPKKELFRFSHQVPARMLTGEEAENIPKGCMELDPAACPLELLQIITEEEGRKEEEVTTAEGC